MSSGKWRPFCLHLNVFPPCQEWLVTYYQSRQQISNILPCLCSYAMMTMIWLTSTIRMHISIYCKHVHKILRKFCFFILIINFEILHMKYVCIFDNVKFLNIGSVCASFTASHFTKGSFWQFECTVKIISPSCYIELHVGQDQWIIYHRQYIVG